MRPNTPFLGCARHLVGRFTVLYALALSLACCLPAQANQLFWWDAGLSGIKAAGLDGSNERFIMNLPGIVAGLAIDSEHKWLYWSQADIIGQFGSIRRSRFDGSDQQTLFSYPATRRAIGVTIDPVSERIFWTDTDNQGFNGSIHGANLDGSNPVVVYEGGLSQPFGITVDPTTSTLFWTDAAGLKIYRVQENGSNFQTLFSTDLVNPRGITFDPATQTLIWTDNLKFRIEASQADGSQRTKLLDYQTPDGIVFSPIDNRLYWADFAFPGKIVSSNPDGSDLTPVITGQQYPRYIALYVPEPSSFALLMMGGAALAWQVRRVRPRA